ncbi:MAG: hypothetical protein NVSMB48_04660 [Marmoricola sp.]
MTYRLRSQASSPGDARVFACACAEDLDPEARIALELIVSELVTNAVQHGDGDITMSLAPTDEGIRVAVHDYGDGRPEPRATDARSTRGRGLQLVQSLASVWGVSSTGDSGKTVWAQVAGTAAPPSTTTSDIHGANRETGTSP